MRIEVNGRRGNVRNLDQRVDLLERAVRQLQNRVYDLEAEQTPIQTFWTCKLVTDSFNRTYYGETLISRGAAERSAHKRCLEAETFDSNCSANSSRTTCTQD